MSTKALSAAFLILTALTMFVHAERTKAQPNSQYQISTFDPIPLCPYRKCPTRPADPAHRTVR